MIRRYPPRSPRGQYQDFHFFAGSQRPNGFEPRSFAPQQQAAAIESPADPIEPTAPAQPTAPAPPQPARHEIIIPMSPEKAAGLGFIPGEPEPEPVSTEALERALEYLAQTDGPDAIPAFSDPPAIDQLESLRSKTGDVAAYVQPPEQPAPKARVRKAKPAPQFATPRKARGRSRQAAQADRPSQTSPTRSGHERHCTICSHPYRAEIENEFVHWHAIGHIAYDYKVSRSAIYRHAYALSLFSRRNHRLRFALGHLIDRVQDVDPTADSIVRAIHAFARINDDGDWVEPPAHVIVSSGGIRREAAAPGARRPIAISLDSPALGNVIDVPSGVALPGVSSALSRDGAVPGTVNRVETDASH